MSISTTTSSERLTQLFKKHAPFSIIEAGNRLAQEGRVVESSKSGDQVQAIVREDSGTSHSITLNILSDHEIEPTCSCTSTEDLAEQWCPHVVAGLRRAHELGFFEPHSGFVAKEATYRLNISSPTEIAAIIKQLHETPTATPVQEKVTPYDVAIVLDVSTDRLGVKLLFNDVVQTPAIFEGYRSYSRRALDNILLQILDDEGSWDEEHSLWYINSSKGIELVLGLIEEYKDAARFTNLESALFAEAALEARLELDWQDTSLCLRMCWILPDGSEQVKDQALLGTGPFWVAINNVIYRISERAARIASLFPHASSLTLSRAQAAPLLEVLTQEKTPAPHIRIYNPELQPQVEIAIPSPRIIVERNEENSDHFSSRANLQIRANIEFRYPQTSSEKNVVYLPNRVLENACIEQLSEIGFSPLANKNSYAVSGDAALDLLSEGRKRFPSTWQVEGFEAIRKGIRFVDLSLNINLNAAAPKEVSKQKDPDRRSGAIDWFDAHVSLIQNNANVPISTLFKSGRSDGDHWIMLDSGAYARVPGGSLGQLKTTLGLLDTNFKLSNAIRTKLTTAQAFSLSRFQDSQVKISLDDRLKEVSRKLENFEKIKQLPISKNFHGKLRSYQTEGLSWLYFLHELSLGGILADEMGLGKTVQTLALIQHLKDKRKNAKSPTLVIAPTSVITNWVYEAKRFAPGLKVLLLHGTQRKTTFNQIPEHDIVITSYALLRLDRFELEKYEFEYVILDEAQNIKNPDAATTKAAKAVRARHRLALTGTPTENRPLELWSILDFLNPGYLGSVEYFRTYIEKPILESSAENNVAQFLSNKVRPCILRRKKADVEKDLPPKVESVLHVEMADSQRQLYNAILEEVRPRIFEAVNEKGIRGASISILAALLRLRQVCNHPNSIESLKQLPGYESGKFNLLKDLVLEALESGRKILLFSQFREMLYIIKRWLIDSNINHLYLDGATKNRQDLIDTFNADANVRLFLISLKAGGTGLNLTAADTVIIYDPWWNPAVEGQAVDRAHRIGQSKTVSVYRLVTENSVEQKIMDLKAKKAKIVEALLQSEDSLSVLKLSKADLEQIFSPLPMAVE